MIRTQLTLYLENSPGHLVRTTHALKEAQINIDGISVVEAEEMSMIQVIVSDAAKAHKALEAAGIAFTEEKVSILNLPNRPGALAAVANALAERKIAIHFLYATSPVDTHGDVAVVISADDLDAVEALKLP
jgi:hypothetical protein